MSDDYDTITQRLAHETYTELCDRYPNGEQFMMRGAFEIFMTEIIFKERKEMLVERRDIIIKSLEKCIEREIHGEKR